MSRSNPFTSTMPDVSTAKKHSQFCRCTSVGKKLIRTIRAVMLDDKGDLVAGDFNGAAWRCDNRNNVSTIEEAFAECALPMPPGLGTWVGSRQVG